MAKKSDNDERMKANPEAKDLQNPMEVWKNGTVVPSPTSGEPEFGPLGRVADAGTLGAGDTSPYGIEIQAEIISGQTMRDKPPPKVAAIPTKSVPHSRTPKAG